jgi:hypothetical protein
MSVIRKEKSKRKEKPVLRIGFFSKGFFVKEKF